MKKALEILLNNVFKDDIELIYGEGSYVIVNKIQYSEYQKLYLIDCVLMLSDNCIVEELVHTYPESLKYIINESWKFIVVREKTQLLTSMEFI